MLSDPKASRRAERPEAIEGSGATRLQGIAAQSGGDDVRDVMSGWIGSASSLT